MDSSPARKPKTCPACREQFEQWDRDGNGQISLEEFLLNAQRHE